MSQPYISTTMSKMVQEPASFRILRSGEEDFLRDMFYTSLYVPNGGTPLGKEIIDTPELAIYHENWGSQFSDIAMVAQLGNTKVGAVWGRLIKGHGFVNAESPEIGIAILPEYRNQGIGAQLLRGIIGYYMRAGHPGVSLSVDERNPAVLLYQRLGFETVKQDGHNQTMYLDFAAVEAVV